jgi:hypothetical protein
LSSTSKLLFQGFKIKCKFVLHKIFPNNNDWGGVTGGNKDESSDDKITIIKIMVMVVKKIIVR